MSEKKPPAKRRWYNNMADAYRVSARSYPWIPWVLVGAAISVIGLFLIIAALLHLNWIAWLFVGLLAALTTDMAILSFLVPRALSSQIEDTPGSSKAVLQQIKRGWIIPEEPVAVTREQDLVWRIVGRPGVVLISEGPSSRVRPLLNAEAKRVTRILQNVPVHQIQVGRDEGQVALAKLQAAINKLKNALTSEEVPQVSSRLAALKANNPPICGASERRTRSAGRGGPGRPFPVPGARGSAHRPGGSGPDWPEQRPAAGAQSAERARAPPCGRPHCERTSITYYA